MAVATFYNLEVKEFNAINASGNAMLDGRYTRTVLKALKKLNSYRKVSYGD